MAVYAPPDVEAVCVPILRSLLAAKGRTEAVGTSLPAGWTPASPAFVQLVSDGIPTIDYPIRGLAVVRVVVFAKDPGPAKALASLCLGLLLGYQGDDVVTRVFDGVGPQVALDDATKARMAAVNVTVSVRLTAL